MKARTEKIMWWVFAAACIGMPGFLILKAIGSITGVLE